MRIVVDPAVEGRLLTGDQVVEAMLRSVDTAASEFAADCEVQDGDDLAPATHGTESAESRDDGSFVVQYGSDGSLPELRCAWIPPGASLAAAANAAAHAHGAAAVEARHRGASAGQRGEERKGSEAGWPCLLWTASGERGAWMLHTARAARRTGEVLPLDYRAAESLKCVVAPRVESPWFVHTPSSGPPSARLLLFPCAGASAASYGAAARALAARGLDVMVFSPPGCGPRGDEAPLLRWGQAQDAVRQAMAELVQPPAPHRAPVVVVGHSIGAWFAAEAAPLLGAGPVGAVLLAPAHRMPSPEGHHGPAMEGHTAAAYTAAAQGQPGPVTLAEGRVEEEEMAACVEQRLRALGMDAATASAVAHEPAVRGKIAADTLLAWDRRNAGYGACAPPTRPPCLDGGSG